MSDNAYWDMFYKNGKIEQYLRYRHTLKSKGIDYAGAKPENTKGAGDSN